MQNQEKTRTTSTQASSSAPIPFPHKHSAATQGQIGLAPRDQRPLGDILLEMGAVRAGDLLKAVVLQDREATTLGEILLHNGWVTEQDLYTALSRQWRVSTLDLDTSPCDRRLIDEIGVDVCLANDILPWRRIGGVTFYACARPDRFEKIIEENGLGKGQTRMLLAPGSAIQRHIMALKRTSLIRDAESSVPARESCRAQGSYRPAIFAGVAALIVGASLLAAPLALMTALTIWASVTLLAATFLKVMSFRAALRSKVLKDDDAGTVAARPIALPVISVMVPLFHEDEVATRLVARLSRIDYPRELLDVILVVEDTDEVTQAALKGAKLPRWLRVVSVPEGPIQTKPRALNYALNFCRGKIIGVWDAEDRPDPDQLYKVAQRFAEAPEHTACLQGALDYYNPRHNWLARCFTIEYATWFRALLPGVAQMGLVVPLGGTTLFFKRDILESLGGWDAWNVTEDADLGVRLARHGYQTEILETTTLEEANCRPWPWVKQRSRWLKGYAMTWAVHMRNPRALLAELGMRRFAAFQIQFFGTLSQVLLAPLLWSFWLLTIGEWHPMRDQIAGFANGNGVALIFTLFVASELIGMAISAWATRGTQHRHLWPWIPLMHFYSPLAALAGWKAIYEVVAKPFYWDKTQHGLVDEDEGLTQEIAQAGTTRIPLLGSLGAERNTHSAPTTGPAIASPSVTITTQVEREAANG